MLGLVTLGQIASAFVFVRMTRTFLSSVMATVGVGISKKESTKTSKRNQKMTDTVKHMAFWLFASACGMFMYILTVVIVAISGVSFYGFWSPSGMFFLSVCL